MIRIETEPWKVMVTHAQEAYPDECVGVMFGRNSGSEKLVTLAQRMENVHQGSQRARYELRPEDLRAADIEARRLQLEVIGIYHSHPDADAYFSETDLKNSCPWYSFVVLSVKNGKFDHATSFLPDADQTSARKETLQYGEADG